MMHKYLESQQLITGGEHLQQRFIDAGFVDIKVIKKKIYVGDWEGGYLSIF
jgi:hypothetical protein